MVPASGYGRGCNPLACRPTAAWSLSRKCIICLSGTIAPVNTSVAEVQGHPCLMHARRQEVYLCTVKWGGASSGKGVAYHFPKKARESFFQNDPLNLYANHFLDSLEEMPNCLTLSSSYA